MANGGEKERNNYDLSASRVTICKKYLPQMEFFQHFLFYNELLTSSMFVSFFVQLDKQCQYRAMLQMTSIPNKSKKPVQLELSISCQHPRVKFFIQISPFE
jgi:hypothetical protein